MAIKNIAYAGMMLALVATNAMAARVEFRGSFCLTSTTAACTPEGWVAGDCPAFRYNPPNLGTNGPSTRVSIIGEYYAENYTLLSGNLIGTAYKTVNGTLVWSSGATFTSQMRITSQLPAPLTATSKYVSITGNIKNFDWLPGCDIGFRAAGTRRP
ncbi:MAG: hypothetical protein ACT4SY_07615 [Hyphomicrobiales bacterium]